MEGSPEGSPEVSEQGGLSATPDLQAVGGARSEKMKQEPGERGSDKVVSRLKGSWSGSTTTEAG